MTTKIHHTELAISLGRNTATRLFIVATMLMILVGGSTSVSAIAIRAEKDNIDEVNTQPDFIKTLTLADDTNQTDILEIIDSEFNGYSIDHVPAIEHVDEPPATQNSLTDEVSASETTDDTTGEYLVKGELKDMSEGVRIVDSTLEPHVELMMFCEELEQFGGKYVNFLYNNTTGSPLDLSQSTLTIGDLEVNPHNNGDNQSNQLSQYGYIIYHQHSESERPFGPISYMEMGDHRAMTVILNNKTSISWSVAIDYLGGEEKSTLTKSFEVSSSSQCGFDQKEDDGMIIPAMKYFAVVSAPDGYIRNEETSQTSSEEFEGDGFITIDYDNEQSLGDNQIEEADESEALLETADHIVQTNDDFLILHLTQKKTFDYFFKAFNF